MRRLMLDMPVGTEQRPARVDLAFQTHGTLDAAGRNCIVLPTYYTGTDESYLPWIGPGRAFDTDRWFVVVPNMIGNGRSRVQDQGTGRAWDARTDPVIRVADNVAAQHLLLEYLRVRHVALIAGWSMGGLQAYQWAVSYPALVGAVLTVCASARCWPLNGMFLQGVSSHLLGAFTADRTEQAQHLAAFARAYAGWAFSAEYFRNELWRSDGFGTLHDLLDGWAADHQSWAPRDLLMMLRTWQDADPTTAGGTFEQTLAQIQAQVIAMPSTTDMYFTLAENAIEVAAQPHAELRPIESPYGHIAGRPGHLGGVTDQVHRAAADLLA